MNQENKKSPLIVSVGTAKDEPEVYALLKQCNPRSVENWQPIGSSQEDFRFLLRSASRELLASMRVRVAWGSHDLQEQLGFPWPLLTDGDCPMLTTSQSCSLPGGRYLDVLHYQLLDSARSARVGRSRSSFAWHIGVQSVLDLSPEDRAQLARMHYHVGQAGELLESAVMFALPIEGFHDAYLTRSDNDVKDRLPAFICRGREPFQYVPKVSTRPVDKTTALSRRH